MGEYMSKQLITLSQLPTNRKAKIINIHGGHGLIRKLWIMGIRENQIIRIISKQPFQGPVTIEVSGCQMTLGQGMAQKIMVEEF
jgi:ferrous iron transport protein A